MYLFQQAIQITLVPQMERQTQNQEYDPPSALYLSLPEGRKTGQKIFLETKGKNKSWFKKSQLKHYDYRARAVVLMKMNCKLFRKKQKAASQIKSSKIPL